MAMSTAIIENNTQNASGRVQDVAEKLERHIRASELQPGDRYLSAEEGSKLLGESVMTVQRAMALLAKRKILDRRPKAGTFIGETLVTRRGTHSVVHFFIPEECIDERNAHEEHWAHIQGMRSVFPGISVQFNFIPNQNVAYTREIVERAETANNLSGVVLVLASRAMRTYFNQSGIPTVVAGSVETDLTNLCWYTYDQKQIGFLLADWLLQRGHYRLTTVMRDVWSIGEHLLHDGVSQALGQAGLAADALQVRSTPAEYSATTELVRDTLTQGSNPPTGFICRTEFQADCVREVARELGLSNIVDVALCGSPQQANTAKYTCVTPTIDALEQGKLMGTMLRSLIMGEIPDPRGYTIPVQLCPANDKSQ
jgi:DNA-binding transcriptional regulator YhcF (GntR family)